MSVDEEISDLYAGPLGDFTSHRDALAKRLRGEGDRDAAQEVKALRKPSVTAWALNRVCHRKSKRIEALLAAGVELRAAQEQLIASGDRDRLRKASADERQLVDTLVDDAEAELEEAGHAATATSRNRLFATLHAAAADEEARSLLEQGRLVRDYEISDFGFALGGDGGSRSAPEPRRRAKRERGGGDPGAAEAAAERDRAIADATSSLTAARAAQRERRRATKAADAALGSARRRTDTARERLEAARRVLAEAEEALERAQASAERAHDEEHEADAEVERSQAQLERF